LSTFIAGCRTVAAYIFCSVYTLALGTPGLILAILFRQPMILYGLAIGAVRTACAIVGIKYIVEGREHIAADRATIYCVNHVSNLEPPVLFLVLRELFPRFHILYKASLHRLPVLGWGFDFVGFVPIERGNREQSAKAIDRAAQLIRRGGSFMVFPEGTRSRTGELLPFKKGAFTLAIRAQAPIVPVAITGAREAMLPGSPIIRPVTIRIRFGAAVPTAGLGADSREELIKRVHADVQALLQDIRARHTGAAA
jgi:1-acyl-sn-glycerol-3-phosphate acyltransferase